MQNAEIELKFPIDDLDRLQSRLPSLGFQLETPRTFEQNTLYDTPTRALRELKQILRIRQYGDVWTITHKRRPHPAVDARFDPAPRYKVRIETETRIDDGPALASLFEQLGYVAVFRYEKYRTEWSHTPSPIERAMVSAASPPSDVPLNPTFHLVIDETPIGNYAELEGPPAWIDATIMALGIDPATCLTDSYGRLFLTWKQRTGSSVENLTFDLIPASELLQPALR
jgi:adenylate cyclase, class 2